MANYSEDMIACDKGCKAFQGDCIEEDFDGRYGKDTRISFDTPEWHKAIEEAGLA